MNFIKKAIRTISRKLKKRFRLIEARRKGFKYEAPNFIFFPNLSSNSVVIDAGCSYEADFSLYMIKHYGLKAYGVDPTLKHRKALAVLEEKYKGNFMHMPLAIGAVDSTLTFYESENNESGSMLKDHVNVRQDKTISYEVEVVTLKSILPKIGVEKIDILKLDLEGAEYDLLHGINKDDLLPFNQIFIEFHHHALKQFNKTDTKRMVERICNLGYKSFSLDDHNYLFYRS